MKKTLLISAVAAAVLAGCSSTPRGVPAGAVHDRGSMGIQQTVDGVVMVVRHVYTTADTQDTNRNQTLYGTVMGAVGAAVGNVIAESTNNRAVKDLARVTGGAVGAAAGASKAAQAATVPGLDISVRLRDGRVIQVTQTADGYVPAPNERVLVVTTGTKQRVSPFNPLQAAANGIVDEAQKPAARPQAQGPRRPASEMF